MITRFKELDREFKHIPRGRGHRDAKRLFSLAQIELFNLAQAICYELDFKTQRKLDTARRDFMAEVREHLTSGPGHLITKKARTPFWYDFLISPEVSNDFSLEGITVSEASCYLLESAHAAQVRVVRRVTR